MFTINVENHFRASHQLAEPIGTKEPPHCHNWVVTASVSSDTLNDTGLVMDFSRLKSAVDKIVSELDDTSLNKVYFFHQNNPSAENVAKYIYEKLEPSIPKGLKLQSIRVLEEPGCWAEFTK